MKENTLELSFEMYEELKETLIKTLRSELAEARSQLIAAIDTDTIKQLQIRILQLEQTQTRISEVQQERGHRIEQRLQAISERQEQISEDLGAQISGIDEKVAELEIPEELPPRMVQHRVSFSLDATRNFWLFMSMFVVIVVLSVGLYLKWRPDRGRYDNDLKYRYVLMKGEASSKRLSELEELFETERDQRRIDSMRSDVEKYEKLVRRRAALDEQARLKAQEAEQLKRDAAKLKTSSPSLSSAKISRRADNARSGQVATGKPCAKSLRRLWLVATKREEQNKEKANTINQGKNETKTDLHSERIILTLAASVFTFHKQTLKNQLWQQ